MAKKNIIPRKNIFDVRKQYITRFGLEKFAGNYSNDRQFASSEWLCRCKEAREEESHLTLGNCKVFGDLKERFGDLHDDENLVQFFQEVLARRDEIDKETCDGGVTPLLEPILLCSGISQSRDSIQLIVQL